MISDPSPRHERACRLLAEVSRLLEDPSAIESRLAMVARVAAAQLGVWCAVALLDRGGGPRVVALEKSDPATALAARTRLESTSCGPPDGGDTPATRLDLGAEHGLGRVLRTGEAELLAKVEGTARDDLAAMAPDPLLARIELDSFVGVPLRGRSRLLGAFGLGAAGSSRRFDDHDLALAEELARRCALAVENADLCRVSAHAEAVREEVLAVVSHDLRAPLSNIVMASKALEKLVEELPLGESLRQAVLGRSRMISRSATQMSRLVDDLQDFANIEAGRLSVIRNPHDPESIAREAIETFQPMAESSGVLLTGALVPGPVAIDCDRDRILQVLSNLLSNAIHASPRGGTVIVSFAQNGSDVVFSVEDAGPGIPADELPTIFDRYRRGRSATYKGAGLGLAIARRIVELHGGRIWAESVPGRGSSFRFRVPAARTEAVSDVLVVDDDVDIRYSLKAVLELEGYRVALAENGRAAWEWLQSASLPALILLDLMMPVMNGSEFLGLVRTDTRLRSVPVVLLTAFGSLAQSVTAQWQGLVDKPFDVKQIVGLASRYCQARPQKPN